MGRMFTAAQPGSLFSQPVVQGEYAVVMASEMIGGLGYGFGGGGGTGAQAEDGSAESGFGGGGGGGGSMMARPVAAISIGPDGVRVEPIMDPTKIAIAFFTTLAAIVVSLRRISRRVEELK
ncbi:MAG: hypothetical protein KBE23_07060 [Chloroflexi bacterium]|nr:hypothetical protein [Chloroflexota bacterium]MBP7042486.1 hypothetical protein [Chloroflexota bacterium]